MARKLPWAEDSGPTPKRIRTAHTPRPRQNQDDSDEAVASRAARVKTLTSTPSNKKPTLRTPSTSPPPRPPTAESMHEGYGADDIYMMVEDEFQTVAQSFTAHLHHAEYKRLMKKARDAPPKELPEPMSPAMMRNETRRRLYQEALHGKQDKAVSKVTRGGISTAAGEADEDKIEDPWSGTSLAGLMGSNARQKVSLVGLEKMSSGTRAARGYSRTELSQPDKIQSIFEKFARSPTEKKPPIGTTTGRPKAGRQEDVPSTLTKRSSAAPMGRTMEKHVEQHHFNSGKSLATAAHELPTDRTASRQPAIPTSRSPIKPSVLMKRKKPKPEDEEDRLGTVPLFLG